MRRKQVSQLWIYFGGWVISNEDFLQRLIGVLSFAKLRASYGTTGNDQIGDYRYLSLYNVMGLAVPTKIQYCYAPNSIPNMYLQWRKLGNYNSELIWDFGTTNLLSIQIII